MPRIIVTPGEIIETAVSGDVTRSLPSAGIQLLSGAATGGYAGPWAIETQTLTVTYFRVPMSYSYTSGTNVESLSATNIRLTTIGKTHLQVKIEAAYSMRKDYGTYATSSHQQLQEFTIVSESDKFGRDYGDYETSANKYNLGPAGSVRTSKPYIRRVAWDDNIHTETSKTVVGTNFLYLAYDGTVPMNIVNSIDALGNFNAGGVPGAANAYVPYNGSREAMSLFESYADYQIAGTYARDKESDASFADWLTTIAQTITTEKMLRGRYNLGTDYIAGTVNNSGGVTTMTSVALIGEGETTFRIGIPQYSGNRHLY